MNDCADCIDMPIKDARSVIMEEWAVLAWTESVMVVDPEEIGKLDNKRIVNRLCTLKGVGRQTAEKFRLLGLKRTHLFSQRRCRCL